MRAGKLREEKKTFTFLKAGFVFVATNLQRNQSWLQRRRREFEEGTITIRRRREFQEFERVTEMRGKMASIQQWIWIPTTMCVECLSERASFYLES